MTTAPQNPPPETPRARPRSWYYPAGWGCLFWIFMFFLIYLLLGLFWAPAWYPWYWR